MRFASIRRCGSKADEESRLTAMDSKGQTVTTHHRLSIPVFAIVACFLQSASWQVARLQPEAGEKLGRQAERFHSGEPDQDSAPTRFAERFVTALVSNELDQAFQLRKRPGEPTDAQSATAWKAAVMRSRDETSVVKKNRSSQGAVGWFYPCSALLTRDATVLDVGPGEILSRDAFDRPTSWWVWTRVRYDSSSRLWFEGDNSETSGRLSRAEVGLSLDRGNNQFHVDDECSLGDVLIHSDGR